MLLTIGAFFKILNIEIEAKFFIRIDYYSGAQVI